MLRKKMGLTLVEKLAMQQAMISATQQLAHWPQESSSERQLAAVYQLQIQEENQMKTEEKYRGEELTWNGI